MRVQQIMKKGFSMKTITKSIITSLLLIGVLPNISSAIEINESKDFTTSYYLNTKPPTTVQHISHGNTIRPSRVNGPKIKELKLPVSIFTGLIKNKFNGLKIHLNNYGSRDGNSWYRGNSSYVKLPSSLGNKKYSFSIDPINKIPYRYYINDINLKSLKVSTSGNRFALKFAFEEDGTEIKGRCATNNYLKKGLCIKGSDASAPDVHISKAVASVFLTPSIRNNSISFSTVATDFKANIRVGKTCQRLGSLCTSIFDYKSYIKKEVRKSLKKIIDKNSIRNKIASSLRGELLKVGIKKIISVQIKGQLFIIRYSTPVTRKQ